MKNKNQILYRSLLEFSWFAEGDMGVYIDNALTLKDYALGKCKNYTIGFMADLTAAHIIETLILNIHETWDLLNNTLKDLGEKPLTSNNDYTDLDKIRNKLLAHRLANSIYSPEHKIWYKQNYGSLEKTFELLRRVALKLSSKIDELEERGKIAAPIRPTRINRIEIKEILNRLST